MLAIHIEETPEEIIVSRCECVIARWEMTHKDYDGELVKFLTEVLSTLGHTVETEGGYGDCVRMLTGD